ncbi:MAG: hypothetical protein CV087_10405 [Candidatus Brocadia sp. WS118]|nr:MAG: hypothetical protein CV087_10405 [Candidatus Brocadia sp. WS118]
MDNITKTDSKPKRTAISVFWNTRQMMRDFVSEIQISVTDDDLVRIAMKRLIADYKREGLNVLKEPGSNGTAA